MDSTHSVRPKRVLGFFVLVTLNLAVITSLRNVPLVAQYGLSSISYCIISALVFILPTALVSAELATGWPKAGGVFIWVKEALGDKWGFTAIWLQWVHNLPWYPAMLTFIGTLFAYSFGAPELAQNKVFALTVTLVGFWAITILNFFGVKTSGWFSSISVILGALLPGVLLIILGFVWYGKGMPSEINFTWKGVLPDFKNFNNIAFLTGMFLTFAGLEVTAVHAKDVINPRKNYPRAIFLAALISLILFSVGALVIAMVIPSDSISLVSGIIDVFIQTLAVVKMTKLAYVIALFIAIGALGELNAWVLGVAKGLFITGRHGLLPPFFQKVNKHGTPTNILIFQAIIVSLASVVFLLMKSVDTAYWMLIAISAQLYILMYIMMFISGIKLRYSKPDVNREYRISGGNYGMWLIAGVGIIAGTFAVIVGFVPPIDLQIHSKFSYVLTMAIILVVLSVFPLIMQMFKKAEWMPTPHNDLLDGQE